MKNIKIVHENYTVEIEEPKLYLDNKSRGRSGHMSHAMTEFAPGKYINFNANCSGVFDDGHSTYGWIEYRISEDNGETYSPVYEFPYSKEAFLDGIFKVSVEKAVSTKENNIVALCLRNLGPCCSPWETPTVVISNDSGKSWGEPKEMCEFKGRIYDAIAHKGIIYALEFCNDGTKSFLGCEEEHLYRIFKSDDHGETFEELCVVPFDTTKDRSYGAMLFDDNDNLHIFSYNRYDERNIDHIISTDFGKTWGKHHTNYLAKGIRNPQVALIDGIFIIHGRAEDEQGFIVYSSTDCENFDEGTFVVEFKACCYYSNNILLKDKSGGNKLLIQYSNPYNGHGHAVNLMHTNLRIVK